MFTKREAYQRCSLNRVRLERRDREWRVTLNEWPNGLRSTEDKAYYTDDIEDAVLTGAEMRRLEDMPISSSPIHHMDSYSYVIPCGEGDKVFTHGHGASIHPNEVTCKKCLSSIGGMMRRNETSQARKAA